MRAASLAAYATTDFYSAAFLACLDDVQLVDVVWHGKRAEFVFEADGIDIREALAGLRSGTAMVPAKRLIDAIGALKRELYSSPR